MTNEDMILRLLREHGPRSPREIEEKPPQKMSARDARIAMQQLMDDGSVVLDDHLKLAPVPR